MAEAMVQINVRVTPEIAAKINAMHGSTSDVVRAALEHYFTPAGKEKK